MAAIYGQGGKLWKVVTFLQSQDGFWCTACVKRSLEFPRKDQIDDLIRQIGRARRHFERSEKQTCSGCDESKTCVRSAANSRSHTRP
jgi:hypothetical protein